MITVNSGFTEMLAIIAPLIVLGITAGIIVLFAVLSKRHGKIFKTSAAFVGVLGIVGAFASNMAILEKNTFESFDNPVVAQAVVDGTAKDIGTFEVATKSASINEGLFKNTVMDVADLDKITEMRQGDGFYRTLAQGEELEFTAERNSTEDMGSVSYEVVEGTVSYTEDSIRVEITDGAGNVEVFESAVA